MKNYFILLFGLITGLSFSQTNVFGPTISYQSQSGNMAKIGAFYLHNSGTDFTFKIDATANLANFRNKFVAIPEVGFTYYPKPNYLVLPMVEAEISPYTVTPKIGLSFLSIVDIAFGYGIETNTKKNLKPIKGFTFSFGLNIPLTW